MKLPTHGAADEVAGPDARAHNTMCALTRFRFDIIRESIRSEAAYGALVPTKVCSRSSSLRTRRIGKSVPGLASLFPVSMDPRRSDYVLPVLFRPRLATCVRGLVSDPGRRACLILC